MAKRNEGEPYVVEAFKAGATQALLDIQNAAVDAVTSDLNDVINKYYSMDWVFVVVAMELTAQALKKHLDPAGLQLEESLTRGAVSLSMVVKDRGGGMSFFAEKGAPFAAAR